MTQPATKSPDSPATISDRSADAAAAEVNLPYFSVKFSVVVEQTYTVQAKDRVVAMMIADHMHRYNDVCDNTVLTVRSNLPTTVTQLP